MFNQESFNLDELKDLFSFHGDDPGKFFPLLKKLRYIIGVKFSKLVIPILSWAAIAMAMGRIAKMTLKTSNKVFEI